MDYQRVYMRIITRAKHQGRVKGGDVYYESHHIIPKSLGGNNSSENLVLLTGKEHFICHLLLVRIHVDNHINHVKMLRALLMLRAKHQNHVGRHITSRTYERVKMMLYGNGGLLVGTNSPFYGRTHSEQTRRNLSVSRTGVRNPQYGKEPWNKGKTKKTDQRISSAADKSKKSLYNTDRPQISDRTKQQLSEKARERGLGKVKTEKHRNSIKHYARAFAATDEGKQKLEQMKNKSLEATKGVKKERVVCPHCLKEGGKPAMIRFHFDNCKEQA